MAVTWSGSQCAKVYWSEWENGRDDVLLLDWFLGNKMSSLVLLKVEQDGKKYFKTLKNYPVLILEDCTAQWIYIQDNSRHYSSKAAQEWFSINSISRGEWPAYSINFSTIDNLWGIVARDIYANEC